MHDDVDTSAGDARSRLCLCVARVDAFDGAAADVLLGDEEQRRLAAIGNGTTRRRSRAGAALLAHALARQLGDRALGQPVTRTARGRPVHPNARVSISHSGDVVACAVSTAGEVGVDVQITGTAHRLVAIADAYFAPGEAVWLRDQDDHAFYRLWALKEAYLKALGVGLVGGLDRLDLRIEAPHIRGRVRGTEPVHLHLYQFDSYYCGLAVRPPAAGWQQPPGDPGGYAPATYRYASGEGLVNWPLTALATGSAEPADTP